MLLTQKSLACHEKCQFLVTFSINANFYVSSERVVTLFGNTLFILHNHKNTSVE